MYGFFLCSLIGGAAVVLFFDVLLVPQSIATDFA